ncbi:MAG TPA: hypothetical protein VHR66_04805 [Gemmataceae bacterium]|jgi:hypothetical protein|nr:hypothetical protein [Gemmataceae bacterium]
MFHNRWVRRVAIGLALAFLLVVGGFFALRYNMHHKGAKRWQAATAHLDATDPHWRLKDYETERSPIPDEQNSALLVARFKLAMSGRYFDMSRPDKTYLYDDVPPNHELDDEGVETLDRLLGDNAAAIAVGRMFKDRPHGLRRYAIKPDVISTLLPEVQDTRNISTGLDLYCEQLSRLELHGAAMQMVPAILNVGRSIDHEPFIISFLVRVACEQTTLRRVQRILALGEPHGGLAEAQAALFEEADADFYFDFLRGERACMDLLYTNLQNGTLPPEFLVAVLDDNFTGRTPKSSMEARARAWAHEPYVPSDHAIYLELMTQANEVRALPEHQRRAAIKAIQVPTKNRTTALVRQMLPNCLKVHDAALRLRAGLRCAGTAIAVERFRQLNGRWPEALDEIPSDILAAMPRDPIDGNLLRYLRREDGVTIYSIGLDEVDNGGNIPDPPLTLVAPNSDIGVRLFDPHHRRRPPLARNRWPIDFDYPSALGPPGGPPPAFMPGDVEEPTYIKRAPEPREIDESGATIVRPMPNPVRFPKIDD